MFILAFIFIMLRLFYPLAFAVRTNLLILVGILITLPLLYSLAFFKPLWYYILCYSDQHAHLVVIFIKFRLLYSLAFFRHLWYYILCYSGQYAHLGCYYSFVSVAVHIGLLQAPVILYALLSDPTTHILYYSVTPLLGVKWIKNIISFFMLRRAYLYNMYNSCALVEWGWPPTRPQWMQWFPRKLRKPALLFIVCELDHRRIY